MRRSIVMALTAAALATTLQAGSDVGIVTFANSGAPAAQPAFARGLALLHNFEYMAAAESFREAQTIDPGFAVAYWGEAMTHTHPIWFQQNADAARAILQRLGPTAEERAAKAGTDRERAYLSTIEVLYGPGSKNERDFKFADAMAALQQKYPGDIDAIAFHALAILGTSHNDRDTAKYMRAAALLEEVFPKNESHPGVLHYLIHSYDDPVHAPLGMRAARRYGAVAPNAGHALHMTSHIFIAMGMWDDVVDANKRAVAVVNRQREAKGRSPQNCGHYPTWLHYGLLQRNEKKEAKAMLDACRADALDPDYKTAGMMDTEKRRFAEHAQMVANHVMAGGSFDEASPAAIPEKYPEARFTLAYAAAMDSYRRGDATGVSRHADALRTLANAAKIKAASEAYHAACMPGMNMGSTANDEARMAIIVEQAAALALILSGRHDEALAALRKVAAAEQAMPFEFGPPFIEKPSHELLGDHLLSMKRKAEAAQAYRDALTRTPGRVAAVEGLRKAN